MLHPYSAMKAQYENWAATAIVTNRSGVDEAVHICERHLDYGGLIIE